MKETSVFFLNMKHNNYIRIHHRRREEIEGGGVLATNRFLSPNFHYLHHNLMCCIPTGTPPPSCSDTYLYRTSSYNSVYLIKKFSNNFSKIYEAIVL